MEGVGGVDPSECALVAAGELDTPAVPDHGIDAGAANRLGYHAAPHERTHNPGVGALGVVRGEIVDPACGPDRDRALRQTHRCAHPDRAGTLWCRVLAVDVVVAWDGE